MADTIDINGADPIPQGQNPMPRPRVDLAPVCFQGTFTNPCFWLLLGIMGTLAVQYVMTKRK